MRVKIVKADPNQGADGRRMGESITPADAARTTWREQIPLSGIVGYG
jgi:hypothetical protein